MKEGEELKAPRYASAAATRDHVTTRDIVPTLSLKALNRLLIKKRKSIGKRGNLYRIPIITVIEGL